MRRDRGIGLGLLALCGLLYWQTGGIPAQPFLPIGPAFYPRVILGLLAGLAVWLILEDLAAGRALARPAAGATGQPANYRAVGMCFLVFFAYILGLSLIGYLASTFLFVLALGWIMGPRQQRGLPKLVAIAVGTTLVTYLLFERYLRVFLPRGLLF
ncbi:MAG TPA: tripartite tricarboxylate transporter TctB family protein [Candidatus Methylomirabilis sp.]|nr:tripartite tricarboxylate transporter TctB family protein [Candidatus Methylomirabilis sp.]HSC69846.1 tripartite tricarboxylate transporter TctB family protein [Candidatus Methylomirabilis sp.]